MLGRIEEGGWIFGGVDVCQDPNPVPALVPSPLLSLVLSQVPLSRLPPNGCSMHSVGSPASGAGLQCNLTPSLVLMLYRSIDAGGGALAHERRAAPLCRSCISDADAVRSITVGARDSLCGGSAGIGGRRAIGRPIGEAAWP